MSRRRPDSARDEVCPARATTGPAGAGRGSRWGTATHIATLPDSAQDEVRPSRATTAPASKGRESSPVTAMHTATLTSRATTPA